MRQELWDICPPANAVAIFSDLFKQTLESLTLRYLNEFPTYRRLDQFRLDIGVILYTTYELMFHVSSSSGQLLNLESVAHSQPYFTIHSCCCKLLAILAVTTSSLTDLYKVYKKIYHKKSRRRKQTTDSEEETGYYSYWLSWLQPDTIPRNVTRLCDMQTTTALYLQIKLMLAQPEHQWHNLIQVITMKNFTLPIMMLTQGNLNVSTLGRTSVTTTVNTSHSSSTSASTSSTCRLAFCDGACDLLNVEHLFEPFIMVLLHCNKPSSLYNVLLPVIDRGNQWSLLNSDTFYQNMKTEMPQWMQVLTTIIADKMDAVIASVVTKVSNSLSQSNDMDIRDYMQSFPCGCMLDEELSLKKEVNYSEMIVREVLIKLPTAVSQLNISVCVALQQLGNHLQEQTPYVSDISDRFVLQTLGFTLSDSLSNQKYLEEINEGTIPSEVLACLKASAECVYAALSKGTDVTHLKLSKQHMQCLTENHHWIAEQIEEVVHNVKNRESLWPDLDVDGSTAENFAEFATTNIVADILETKKGETYLRQIHNLICNNQNWIFFSLDIHEYLDQSLPLEQQTFIPDILDHSDERAKAKQNPLALYNRIGNFLIDFDLIRRKTEDVTGLLQSDLGLTDLSFASLLQHRPDFQDETQLDATEKRHVKLLKGKFHIVSGEDTL
ncbi:uncharacterized protein KIAA0825-like [Watersipora subatra]|uniref:uncharacterized protein KIAA0825-like n=1 Tax=Watersipora subatra TaxID=2589382 RepID=UPI00355BC542